MIDQPTAQGLLNAGGNPNGQPNSDVIRRYWSDDEALGRTRNRFVIDFGPAATEASTMPRSRGYRC